MKEISEQINNQQISHVILQAGVGGMAAAMVAGIASYLNHVPKIIIVEPESAACVLESIKTGKIEKISIEKESLMGGMSCGEVSLVPWQILKNSVSHCVTFLMIIFQKLLSFLQIVNLVMKKLLVENAQHQEL